ncbi:MAG: S1/P1 nuclease [Candidatus Xenobia bacterium]
MNSTGHMVLFQLAYNHMTPQAQQRVAQILADPNNPEENGYETTDVDNDVPSAATYPDVYKSWARQHGQDGESYLHFYNNPIGDPRYTAGKSAASPNGLTWFAQQMGILKDSSSDQDSKADALRWVIHEYGDIGAQPGHAVNGFSAQFPKGDGGGNGLKINWGSSGRWDTDLHALLDAGGAHPNPNDPSRSVNNFKDLREPLSREGRQFIESLAEQIGNSYPRASFTTQQLQDQDPNDWVQTLKGQAEQIWPQFNKGDELAPDDPRLASIEHLMDQNVALSAYRLADMCNQLFGGDNNSNVSMASAAMPKAPLASLEPKPPTAPAPARPQPAPAAPQAPQAPHESWVKAAWHHLFGR